MRTSAGNTRIKRSILLISSGKSHPPRIGSVLEGAGFHVQFSAWKTLQPKKGGIRQIADSERAAPGGKTAAGLEGASIAQLHQDLLAHRRSITAILNLAPAYSPGCWRPVLLFMIPPAHPAQCSNPWERYPAVCPNGFPGANILYCASPAKNKPPFTPPIRPSFRRSSHSPAASAEDSWPSHCRPGTRSEWCSSFITARARWMPGAAAS